MKRYQQIFPFDPDLALRRLLVTGWTREYAEGFVENIVGIVTSLCEMPDAPPSRDALLLLVEPDEAWALRQAIPEIVGIRPDLKTLPDIHKHLLDIEEKLSIAMIERANPSSTPRPS